MRVNLAATAGAALLAAVSHVRHPAQVVVSIAASSAFLALLTRRGQFTGSDWFTVRVLLAGNLLVFAVSYAHQLGVTLAVSAALFGLAVLVVAIWARLSSDERRSETDEERHVAVKQQSARPSAAAARHHDDGRRWSNGRHSELSSRREPRASTRIRSSKR
jgi:hypothetical protein